MAKKSRFIKAIVIHCSAGFGSLESVQNFWKKSLGWKAPGYHYFIDEDGTIHQLAPITDVTNGVAGHNSSIVNISYKGGVDRKNVNKAVDTRTTEQKCAIKHCINEVLDELSKTQDVSKIEIKGHRDFSPDKNGNGIIEAWERIKECPSFDAIPEYKHMVSDFLESRR